MVNKSRVPVTSRSSSVRTYETELPPLSRLGGYTSAHYPRTKKNAEIDPVMRKLRSPKARSQYKKAKESVIQRHALMDYLASDEGSCDEFCEFD